ncbi:Tubby c-terminal-like domain [Globisporangium polare]
MTKQSTIDTLNLQLAPQHKPVAAINAKFCHPDSVTLHLHEKFWSLTGDDFTIKDASSGADVFRIKGAVFTLHEKKTLLDSSGATIVNMKEEIFALTPNYQVYAGSDSHNKLFKIKAKLTILETSLRVEFTNAATGQQCFMGLEGDWCHRKALIWLDRGKTGVREPVGKVYRPLTASGNLLFGTQDYYLAVAPNVDIALMVLICIVLDEKASDFI